MTQIKNSVAWVTGASSGIGLALVKELLNKGAKVIISARRKALLEDIRNASPQKDNIFILPLDLADIDQMAEAAKLANDAFGRIDILFNNGGISQRSMALDTPIEVDRKIMEIDYFGTIALTKAVAPYMIKQKSGHFVVTSSLVGKFGSPWRSSYAAAKHALHGFFDSLRTELHDDKIKVTMVCPGFIKTEVSINALGADGQPTGEMDDAQANGMSAEECAGKILSAVEKNKLEEVIGGKEKYGVLVKRLFPSLFAKIIRKQNVR